MTQRDRNRAIAPALILGACVGLSAATFAADYDLVIKGGRVMDPETMYDEIANVGVKNGRIAAITKEKGHRIHTVGITTGAHDA